MNELTFAGGVHPRYGKELSRDSVPAVCLPKGDLVFFTGQHIGKPAVPVVEKGDRVLVGQELARQDGFVSARVLSSVSGTVKAVEMRPAASGAKDLAIVVENDGQYTPAEGIGKQADPEELSREEIIEKVREAGIIGMGGAGFPTHVKLTVKEPEKIRFVIANGAECEPYITCDDQLMRTHPREIVKGVQVMLRLFPRAEGVIAIEDNKPEAIREMEAACAADPRIRVAVCKTKYPQGGERSLISAIAGKHLKLGMLPADAGCVVDNVATVQAIYRAVCLGEPLTERCVTVSGEGVLHPGNYTVKIGTNAGELIDLCGCRDDVKKILSGGPMMGLALSSRDVPIGRNNNAITALTDDPAERAESQMTACLRCGRCNRVCPLGLSPQLMQVAAQRKDYDRYEHKLYGLECIACGCCTYNCPAKRPLMQLFRQTKAEIMAAKKR